MPRFLLIALLAASTLRAQPFKIAVIGLTHGHVAGFFNNALKRDDIQIVGIAEPDRQLFDKYAKLHNLSPDLYSRPPQRCWPTPHPKAWSATPAPSNICMP